MIPNAAAGVQETLRSRPCPRCPLCGSGGRTLHAALRDWTFAAPGEWRMVRCVEDACGSLWLDPAPLPEDLGLAYRHYYTHGAEPAPAGPLRALYRWTREGYLSRRYGYPATAPWLPRTLLAMAASAWPEAREYLERRVMLLPRRHGGRLLDVGCGNGSFIRFMGGLGWQAEGVDFDPAAVAAARAAGLRVGLGGLSEQRYPAGSFDAVTLHHVIEHLPDPIDVLRECRRILDPRGQLTLVTPNAASYGHATFGEHWRGLEPPRHLQIFTLPSLQASLRLAGFSEVRIDPSVQLSRTIFRESCSIRGAARGRSERPGAAAAFGFVARETWITRRRPDRGEELVAVARP